VDEQELARVREVVLRAHPDVVPELVQGATLDELLGSVEPAQAAFAAVSERVKPADPVAAPPVAPPAVPAGAGTAAIDPGTLPAHELIRRGIVTRGPGARG
jgi:hypothetical protein